MTKKELSERIVTSIIDNELNDSNNYLSIEDYKRELEKAINDELKELIIIAGQMVE